MKIYKELLVLGVVGILSVVALAVSLYLNSDGQTKATVDNVTPTTIEVLESGE